MTGCEEEQKIYDKTSTRQQQKKRHMKPIIEPRLNIDRQICVQRQPVQPLIPTARNPDCIILPRSKNLMQIISILLLIFLCNPSAYLYTLAFTINNIASHATTCSGHRQHTSRNKDQMIKSSRAIHKMSQQITSKLSSIASSKCPDDAPTTQLSKSIIAAKRHKLSFAIAGGGSNAISSLVSTPGASAVLLNASVLYDRNSYCQYISQHISNPNDVDNYGSRSGKFGFASSGAAVLLSQAALHHAFQIQSAIVDMTKKAVAIGCTSTLVSLGKEDRNSRAHISLVAGDGKGFIWDVVLSNQASKDGDERRNRTEEEELLAQLILTLVHQYSCEDNDGIDPDALLNRIGDQLSISISDGSKSVQDAAQIVIDKSDKTDAIIIAPKQESLACSMIPLAHTVIPSDPIIFPGSFNPPHIGHILLARAAVKTMTRKKKEELEKYFQYTDGKVSNAIEDMWNTTEYQSFHSLADDNLEEGPFSVLFEMSLTNADKPPMEVADVSTRVERFGRLPQDQQTASSMPKDWGVLLTSAPLFIDKVRVMNKYLSPSGAAVLSNKRQITFVIGTDTMVRIINPKYYGNDNENMLQAVREMGNEGVHFVVGGRVEQIKGSDSEIMEAKFITGESELEGLPKDVRNMFTIIREEDFRVDISSSELRGKMNA